MGIRTYCRADVQRVVELYNETTKKYNWQNLNDEQKKIILFDDLKFAHDFFSSNITFILEDDSKILGFVLMTKEGYIRCLYVDQNSLKKGYGKKLLFFIEQKAREYGLKIVYLHASTFASKNRIYEKLGYKNKGKEVYKVVGVDFKGDRMEKTL